MIDADCLNESLDCRTRLAHGHETTPAFLKKTAEIRIVVLEPLQRFQGIRNSAQQPLGNGGKQQGIPLLRLSRENTLRCCKQLREALLTEQRTQIGDFSSGRRQNFQLMLAINTRGRRGISDLMNCPEEMLVGPYSLDRFCPVI